MSNSNFDIKQLSDLLKTDKEESDSEDDQPGMFKTGPGDIGKSKLNNVSINRSASGDGPHSNDQADPDAIWQAHEVIDQPVGEEHFDPREQPEYDIKYQQALSPETIFLQMTNKTASTASCENLIISIHMKDESKNAIDLSITNSTLDIRSPLYRLHLSLPHPVNAEKGSAEWDSGREVLTVQLLMVREYDFINF